VNILKKQLWTADKAWSSSFGVGLDANNSSLYNLNMNHKQKPQNQSDPSVQPKQWKRDMRFGEWNVRSLYRSGSITTVVWKLARYKLDLVGVQEVRWDNRKHCNCRGLYFLVWQRE
jgi:hypothetical protein